MYGEKLKEIDNLSTKDAVEVGVSQARQKNGTGSIKEKSGLFRPAPSLLFDFLERNSGSPRKALHKSTNAPSRNRKDACRIFAVMNAAGWLQ